MKTTTKNVGGNLIQQNNNTNSINNNKDISSKRMSIQHLQHPASLQSLHQIHQQQIHPHQQLMAAHQHHQQMMWHARSYESGIGIYDHLNYLLEQLPYYYYCGNPNINTTNTPTQHQQQQPIQQQLPLQIQQQPQQPNMIDNLNNNNNDWTDESTINTKFIDRRQMLKQQLQQQEQEYQQKLLLIQQQQYDQRRQLLNMNLKKNNKHAYSTSNLTTTGIYGINNNNNSKNNTNSIINGGIIGGGGGSHSVTGNPNRYSSGHSIYCPSYNLPKCHSESSVFGSTNRNLYYEEIDSDNEFSADSIDHRDYNKNRFQNPIFTHFLRNRFNASGGMGGGGGGGDGSVDMTLNRSSSGQIFLPDDQVQIHQQPSSDRNEREDTPPVMYQERDKYIGRFYVPSNFPRKTSFRTIRKPTDVSYEKLPKKSVSTESFFLDTVEGSGTGDIEDEVKFRKDKTKIDQIYYENAKSKIDEHLDMLVKKEGEISTKTSAATTPPTIRRKHSFSKTGNLMVNFIKPGKNKTLQKLEEARKRLRSSFGLRSSEKH